MCWARRTQGRRLPRGLDALLADAEIPEALDSAHGPRGRTVARGSRLRDWPDVEWRLVRKDDDPASAGSSRHGRDVEMPESELVIRPGEPDLTSSTGRGETPTPGRRFRPSVTPSATRRCRCRSGHQSGAGRQRAQTTDEDARLGARQGDSEAERIEERSAIQPDCPSPGVSRSIRDTGVVPCVSRRLI
jgi:hypothetical protein